MKLKKIMLVALVLLAILTIGAVSASDEVALDDGLAVSDDGDSMESSVNDVDLLSNGDGDDDGGDDAGDLEEVDYQQYLVERVDVCDEDQVVVSLVCPVNATGKFVLHFFDDDYDDYDEYEEVVSDAYYGKEFNWTVGELGIENAGSYYIMLFHLASADDEVDDDTEPILEGDLYVIDSREFRIENTDEGMGINSLLENPLVFSLYCPDGHIGEIVQVEVCGPDLMRNLSRTIKDKQFIDFYANELSMTSEGEYDLSVRVGDYNIYWTVYIESPMDLADEVSLNSLLGWDATLLIVNVPVEIEEGRIIIEIEGVEVFNKTLSDFKHVEETDEYYFWHHPTYGPDSVDENFRAYNVGLGMMEEPEERIYFVSGSLILENHIYTITGNVSLVNSNVAEENGIAIQMVEEDSFELGSDVAIAYILAPEESNGRVEVSADGDLVMDKEISELEMQDEFYYIMASDLDIDEPGEYEIFVYYYEDGYDPIVENSAVFTFNGDDDDDDYFGSVEVYEGDVEYNITDPEDLEKRFAYASVLKDINGSIVIMTYDYDTEIEFFNMELRDIADHEIDEEDPDYEIYYIHLKDLVHFNEFVRIGWFKILLSVGAFDEDDIVADEKDYNMHVDDDIIKFWYNNDDEEFYGEGERIDAIFTSANLITNDIIVAIPKEDLPEDVDDEFQVIIPNEDDEDDGTEPYVATLYLTGLESDGENYYIRVLDVLDWDLLEEIGESMDINLVVQFYRDEEGICFAELGEDDDNLVVFTSPYINDEVFLLNDDWVISFRSFENAADQFFVTVINEDEENFTIPFGFSAYDLDDEESLGEIRLSELNITQTGVYEISVNITNNDGEELAFANRMVIVDTFDIMYEEPDEDEEALSDVTRTMFVVKVSENVTGFVVLYVDDDPVDEIDLADLYHSDVPPHNGRIIQLNDFAITEEGMHSIRVEVYDENGTLLKEGEEEVYIGLGETSVEFYNGGYGCEIGDVIAFDINEPLSDGAYFNISLNGKEAGIFTVVGGFDISDEYLDELYDTYILKPGFYEVEITFFDGEEETDFAAGEFTIGLLNFTLDKDVYYEGETATLTIYDIANPNEAFVVLRPHYLYGAGPIGFDEDMASNPYFPKDIKGVWEDGTVTLDLDDLPAGNYYIHVTYDVADSRDDYDDDIDVRYLSGFIPITVLEQIEPEFELSINDGGSGTDAVVVVKANDGFNGNVSVKIGERDVPVTIVNGTGTVHVTGLSAQSYNATLSYNGSKAFKAAEANTNFRVKTVTSVIPTVAKVTTTYGTAKNIVVTLRDADGGFLANQTVTVTLNGNAYTGTTNANGQVSIAAVPSTLAVKSSYIATIAFAGDDNYSKSTGTVTVVVNKATPKFIAKAKKFKKSAKIKKYTVTLKTDKNVAIKYAKVTIKINKKTYTAKTNKYGKATFKIKKLTKKGKFKALLKYKGNSKFKAISKRVKITIK